MTYALDANVRALAETFGRAQGETDDRVADANAKADAALLAAQQAESAAQADADRAEEAAERARTVVSDVGAIAGDVAQQAAGIVRDEVAAYADRAEAAAGAVAGMQDDIDGAVAASGSAVTAANNAATVAAAAQRAAGLTPMDFGAMGEGGDDTAGMTAALAAGVQLNGAGRTFKINAALLGGMAGLTNATLDFSGAAGLGATRYCLTVAGAGYGASVALTADAAAGTNTLPLASASGLSAGDLLRVESDAWWSQGNNIRLSETVEVLIVSGNTVTLTRPLEWPHLIAANGRVRKISTARTGKWGDLTFIGGGNLNALAFSFVRGLRAGDFSFRGFKARNLGLACCHDFAIGDVDANATDGGSPGLNYGVIVSGGCENGTIKSIRGYRLRHCFTGGGTDGINRAIDVGPITGTESVAGEYDNHAACRDMSTGMITALRPNYEAAEDAVTLQGVNATIGGANIDMRGTGRHGVFVQPSVDAAGDWFFNVNADVRNAAQFSLLIAGLGAASIGSIKGRVGSHKPAQESVYVVPETADIGALDLDVVSRGVTHASRPAIRLAHTNDTAKIRRTRLAVNSDRDNAYRNIMLVGTAANPLANVSIGGVVSGGIHGVHGTNVTAGTVNTTGVLFTGQSSGPTSGI